MVLLNHKNKSDSFSQSLLSSQPSPTVMQIHTSKYGLWITSQMDEAWFGGKKSLALVPLLYEVR